MILKSQILNLKSKNFGFSLLEIIVALAIMALLAAAAIFPLSSFRNSRLIEGAADQIVSIISDARFKTLNSENASQYGIHFEGSRATLFKGAVYSGTDGYNQPTDLHPNLEIFSILLNGGGTDVVFQRLSGKTDNFGTVILRLKSDVSKTKTITIKSTGVADAR